MATLHVLNLIFFKLIVVAIAAAAANVLSCWILPFIILDEYLGLWNNIIGDHFKLLVRSGTFCEKREIVNSIIYPYKSDWLIISDYIKQ